MTINTPRRGRPPKGVARNYFEGQLHALLAERMPQFVRVGRIDTKALGDALGVNPATVHRWLLADRVSAGGAWRIQNVAGGTIVETDLLPFVG